LLNRYDLPRALTLVMWWGVGSTKLSLQCESQAQLVPFAILRRVVVIHTKTYFLQICSQPGKIRKDSHIGGFPAREVTAGHDDDITSRAADRKPPVRSDRTTCARILAPWKQGPGKGNRVARTQYVCTGKYFDYGAFKYRRVRPDSNLTFFPQTSMTDFGVLRSILFEYLVDDLLLTFPKKFQFCSPSSQEEKLSDRDPQPQQGHHQP
jgi:hypothetical protein